MPLISCQELSTLTEPVDDVGAGGTGEGRYSGGVRSATRLLSEPPTAEVLPRVKSVGASLKLKVTVAVLAATLTSLLLTATEAVGVTVSTTKDELVAPVPALPLSSCQELSTLTEAVEMSVPAAPVKVAV